jgi:hypothetical protein
MPELVLARLLAVCQTELQLPFDSFTELVDR